MATTSSNPIPSSYPVIPGTTVTREVFTDLGFNAGDYVYSFANGSVGVPPIMTGSVNAVAYNISLFISGNTYTQNLFSTALSRANFVGPQIPSNTTMTYSGSNTTFGGTQLSATTMQATASKQGPASCVLTNGNIATVFSNSGMTTLYYQITTPGGSAVANGTVATNLYTNEGTVSYYGRNYNICALNAGGFAVVWTTSSNTTNVATYSATGTSIISSTQILAASSSQAVYFPSVAVTSTDIPVVTVSTGYGSGQGRIYVFGNGFLNSYTATAYLTNNGYNCDNNCNILITSTNVIYVTGNDQTSSNYPWYQYFNDLTVSNQNTSVLSYSAKCAPSIVQTANGYIMIAWQNGSNTYTAVYRPQSTSLLTGGNPQSGTFFSNYEMFLVPYSGTSSSPNTTIDSAIMVGPDYTTTNNFSIYLMTFTASNTTITVSNGVVTSAPTTSTSANYPARYSVFPLFGNYFGLTYMANTTAYPTITEINTFPLTNSASYPLFSNTISINPSYGYNLIGVAATTAAANSYGSVIINGTTSLSSSYGTSTTPKYFNYNVTNKSPSISVGNRGYVVNRTVTLQGLE